MADNVNIRLSRSEFYYDGSTVLSHAPVQGNLTMVKKWNGNPTFVTTETRLYDGYGNIVSLKDAKNNETTFAYDAAKNLFVVTQTNPLGHVKSTVWNTGCQVPSSVTETTNNNRQTTYSDYATCCLEIRIWRDQASWHSHLM